MSQHLTQSEEDAMTIAGVPAFNQVSHPVIETKDRMIHVTLDDVDENKITLKFQPYQALKLTTQDCYLSNDESVELEDKLIYQRKSAWIEELKTALHTNDDSANFMDKAIHFIIPAEDDVLEIAAWKVEITYAHKTIIFP